MVKAKRVVVVADMHCGHKCGLTPPKWDATPHKDADPGDIAAYEVRRRVWSFYAKAAAMHAGCDILVCNGDAVHGSDSRSEGIDLLRADRADQAAMAAQAMRLFRAKKTLMTYGTPYHTGVREDWEDLAADLANSAPPQNELHLDVCGKVFSFKHHIGNTKSVASRGTALFSEQIRQMLWAHRKQQPLANVIVRSHVHRCVSVSEPGSDVCCWTTPALQALGDRYGSRVFGGLPIDIGVLVFVVDGYGVRADVDSLSLENMRCDVVKA